jgi:4-hydroxy-3-polyprenylbenzoate decarboxylase
MVGHRSTRNVVDDLIAHGRCIVVDEPFSPSLEIAEIQRRVYASGGPAVLFTKPAATSFPMVCNLFGSIDQARFIFRHTIDQVRRAIELKIDPTAFWRNPWRYKSAPWTALRMRPKVVRSGSIQAASTTISQLPLLKSWPDDGGAFITLPQVLSRSINAPTASRLRHINLGMYRVQLTGNEYIADHEIGLHYQIHRGIGVHHREAIEAGKKLPVTITVGGSPAMTLAAVMPLPEGMSELTFAGALAGHRIPMIDSMEYAPIYADADFAIVGSIDPHLTKPEGPFGDHLGYYAKVHEFPFVNVSKVLHRRDAVWPFTVVGRPPQEDTTFGELIHELTGPILPTVITGVKGVNAVDAAGVHPLLLAIGSERYLPYRKPDRPAELITQACAILGQGQLSLAKYLFITNRFDDESLDVHDTKSFFRHVLQRVDWRRDLHFITRTTIDTLDYSGEGFNEGSKVIIAAVGEPKRELSTALSGAMHFPDIVREAKFAGPGILAIEINRETDIERLVNALEISPSSIDVWKGIPLIVVVDDADFATKSWHNFLWVTFTRSNPATDIDGINAKIVNKHWGCEGPLVIDARRKPHHAPPLIEDEQTSKRIDAFAARGGPLARFL